jgi:hypothetical protein
MVNSYDDLVKFDNRTIQKIMQEVDFNVLATALLGSNEMIKERFLGNISKRTAGMLLEDMEYQYFGPVFDSEIEEAKRHILAVYDCVLHETESPREFQSIFDKYEEETEKQNKIDSQDKYQGEAYLALLFRGKKEIAETVSAVVFDSMETLENFKDEKSDVLLLRGKTRQARKKIVNTIIAVEKQFKKGKFPRVCVLKD